MPKENPLLTIQTNRIIPDAAHEGKSDRAIDIFDLCCYPHLSVIVCICPDLKFGLFYLLKIKTAEIAKGSLMFIVIEFVKILFLLKIVDGHFAPRFRLEKGR